MNIDLNLIFEILKKKSKKWMPRNSNFHSFDDGKWPFRQSLRSKSCMEYRASVLETLIAPAGKSIPATPTQKGHFLIQIDGRGTADFGLKNYRPYNRGKKLKKVVQESETVVPGRPSILPLASTNEQFEVGPPLLFFNTHSKVLTKQQK